MSTMTLAPASQEDSIGAANQQKILAMINVLWRSFPVLGD